LASGVTLLNIVREVSRAPLWLSSSALQRCLCRLSRTEANKTIELVQMICTKRKYSVLEFS
jgi:hypothetical protein